MIRRFLAACCCWSALTGDARAQPIAGFDSQVSRLSECIGSDYCKLTGDVEIELGDARLFADEVEVFVRETRLVATGNVVFSSATATIAADKLEFNWKARTGTFHQAFGSASLGDRVDRSLFGTQEPDAYFRGETVEKLGANKYRITRGAFTTCVQPTPRWEVASSSVVLNLDDYAVLRNSVLKVKGVPVLYLPVLYYPMQEDDRATGFLIPTYGASTVRGQTISNAFFWAAGRSHDATFFHDWFSRTGQGGGAEYRYVAAPGSEGTARLYFLNERETIYENDFGGGTSQTVVPGQRSYELRASAAQTLPARLQARGRVDYFSNVTVRQLYQHNIYDASQRSRAFGGTLNGSWGSYRATGTFDWREVFFGETSSTLYGSAPRISVSRASRPIPGTPIYVTAGTEFARMLFQDRAGGRAVTDRGLSRLDVTPAIRIPFSRWQFLTVNSSIAWRYTYYTESLDERRTQVSEPLVRRYFDLRSDIVGPVFTRIWNTPDNGYAERFKHVIEPAVSLQRVTSIDNRDRIVLLFDGGDYLVGGSTRITYGLTNRFLARRRGAEAGRAREFVSVAINQSYYTDSTASQFDQQYGTSFRGRPPSNFSTVAIGVRVTPTDRLRGSLRMEYDPEISAFQSVSANGSVNVGDWLDASGGWSQRRLGVNVLDPDQLTLDNYLNGSAALRSNRNRVGGTYSFSYDVGRSTLLQQRLVGYYNAQCCGVAVEYQSVDFPAFIRFRVPRDRRFNLSVTLAGIGTFSNLLGAFGTGPR